VCSFTENIADGFKKKGHIREDLEKTTKRGREKRRELGKDVARVKTSDFG